MKLHLNRTILAVGSLNGLLIAPIVLAQPGDAALARPPNRVGNSVLQAMQVGDAAQSESFTTTFQMGVARNPLGPFHGAETKSVWFTAAQGVRGLSIESSYQSDPPYAAVGTPGYEPIDFDSDGNLIVWRTLRKIVVSTPEFNNVYEELQMLRVSPQGVILEEDRHHRITLHPVGDPDSMFEMDQFQIATGRDFARFFQTVKSQSAVRGGLQEIVGSGNFGSGLQGEWNLRVDPDAGHVVREASFFAGETRQLAIQIETVGTEGTGSLKRAASGTITYSPDTAGEFVLDVDVIEVSAESDAERLKEVQALLSAAAQLDQVEIRDLRTPKSGQVPALGK